MKYAAAITLYNPTEKQLLNCDGYIKSFDRVYILDNSEVTNSSLMKRFSNKDGFSYINMDGNEGLAKAFNRVLRDDHIVEFDFLCTLDQDSIFSADEIVKMKKFIEIQEMNEENGIGIYAPVINYGRGIKRRCGFEKKERVITSGAFLKLHVIQKECLKYDELYFIDKFEIDLCKQIRILKYDIVMYYESCLIQFLGDGRSSKHSLHSPLRHYYLFRNRFYFNKKFYPCYKRWVLDFLQTGRHVMWIIFYEPYKIKKCAQVIPALNDYLTGKMGKKQ